MLRFPQGTSDFRELRQDGYVYVDKTPLLSKLLRDSAKVILFPRPRRFGKTLNMTMMRYFFEKTSEDRTSLFAGLAVEKDVDAWKHFQKHPVIFLSFKDIKELSWQETYAKVASLLAGLYGAHDYLLETSCLTQREKVIFQAILDGKALQSNLEDSLKGLVQYLHRYHKERVVLLIDEYDTPLHQAYAKDYFEEAISFFRGLLSAALKDDNGALFKGILTGILRVAKESIFSGLNNLEVYSLIKKNYNHDFGFTEQEVEWLCNQTDHPHDKEEIRMWYNGYQFGSLTIYNPWSVICYLKNRDEGFRPYWVNTASNELLEELLMKEGLGLRGDMEALLEGKTIRKPIEENIVLRDLHVLQNVVWSFLYFSGYLTGKVTLEDGVDQAELRIPNREIARVFDQLVESCFAKCLQNIRPEDITRPLLQGDIPLFEELLQEYMLTALSYHTLAQPNPDTIKREKKVYPEKVYQAFLLGLLVTLRQTHEVKGDPESGFGRCDIVIAPRQPNQPGVVLELKTVRKGEKPAQALLTAQKQLREKDYASSLRERKANPIFQIAAVFDGKKVKVKKVG